MSKIENNEFISFGEIYYNVIYLLKYIAKCPEDYCNKVNYNLEFPGTYIYTIRDFLLELIGELKIYNCDYEFITLYEFETDDFAFMDLFQMYIDKVNYDPYKSMDYIERKAKIISRLEFLKAMIKFDEYITHSIKPESLSKIENYLTTENQSYVRPYIIPEYMIDDISHRCRKVIKSIL